jgi:molybdopterin converting factor small subunit
MAKVIIPTPLRKYTNNTSSFEADGGTVQSAIDELTQQYPDLQKQLYDEQGNIRSFIKVFVGEDDIRNLNNENTEVDEATEISIVPAIAGG